MKIGVIISTYNNPEWLEKTFWGYMAQTRLADEIIIADDGSRSETAELINKYKEFLPLKHVWHEDKGFRKTKILNEALKVADSEYLIFSDQDCIPRADYVETHQKYAKPNFILSGGYFKLPMDISKKITQDDVSNGNAFSLKWLKANGLKSSFKCTKLFQSHGFAAFMNTVTPAKATWNGMNSSTWKELIFKVNGFDERMQYGGEDREMGERLFNLGVKAKQIRYSAIIVHLDHNRPYVNQEALDKNKAIRQITKTQHITYTNYGIIK